MVDTSFLEKVELRATEIITNEFSSKLVYHDITYAREVIDAVKEIAAAEKLTDEELEITLMATWMHLLGFKDIPQDFESPEDFFMQCHENGISIATPFLREIDYPEEKIEKVIEAIRYAYFLEKTKPKLSAVLSDAIEMGFAKPKAQKRLQKMYEELLLLDIIAVGQRNWYELLLTYLTRTDYHTTYGKKILAPAKEKLYRKIQKEQKGLQKQQDFALTKELEISETELKALKKSLSKIKGRDERGIQTIFRTTSKNHYTLNEMVDRKANILISVNAIILSLIIGGLVGEENMSGSRIAPLIILTVTNILSIIFAIAAIRPEITHGAFTEEEIRNKKGNLLFFGNFHKMRVRDFEWGMLQLLNDADYLYMTMIRDIYYLGKILNKKYNSLRLSLNIFMYGLVFTVIAALVGRFYWILL